MSQNNVLNYSTRLLPHLDELKRVPLTNRELERLYTLTDWRVVLIDGRINRMYQEFSAVSIFKALALPYLIPIPSERALARELAEREPLQTLCGFLPEKTPGRPTFWHFRNKYSEVYPELMLRVLISLVLSGSEPNLILPFVTPMSQTAGVPNRHYSKFALDVYRRPIEVWTLPETERPVVTPDKSWAQLSREIDEWSSRKRGMAGGLGLPAEVKTELYDGQTVHFGIHKPEWMDSQTKEADTLTTVGAASLRPYTACNVLVTREHENRRQLLLSLRLAGYRSGTYMLPGGKQRPEESLQECAVRELWEETGIRILKSRPVSLHIRRPPGKPRVLSVGVLVEDYEGEPQRREPSQNTAWQWFDLDKLPTPLFESARIAILQYVNETYHNLQWSDVESCVSESEKPFCQSILPI
jgi:8-oxo-dGTP diphosphatase